MRALTPTVKMGILLASLAGFIALQQSAYIVSQTEQALVRRLGEVVRHVSDAGLKFKVPFLESVIFYDKRVLSVYFDEKEVVIRGDEKDNNKRIIINAYAKYRIVDPLAFYRSVRTEAILSDRLTQTFESVMRRAVGGVTLLEAVSTRRVAVMEDIKRGMNEPASRLGVKVLDVRIVKTDLPQNNSRAVFERMISQHEKEARQTRAEGEEVSQTIKAKADKNVRVLLADAKKTAELIRGDGDAKATSIYAQAFSVDPKFYGFYRTMKAYRNVFDGKGASARFVSGVDNPFFSYIKQSSDIGVGAHLTAPSSKADAPKHKAVSVKPSEGNIEKSKVAPSKATKKNDTPSVSKTQGRSSFAAPADPAR